MVLAENEVFFVGDNGCERDIVYGFQGQETDDETGMVNYKYRMHNVKIGRFFAVDPLAPKYPHNSPYAFSENVVIDHIELEGAEKEDVSQPNGKSFQSNLLTAAKIVEKIPFAATSRSYWIQNPRFFDIKKEDGFQFSTKTMYNNPALILHRFINRNDTKCDCAFAIQFVLIEATVLTYGTDKINASKEPESAYKLKVPLIGEFVFKKAGEQFEAITVNAFESNLFSSKYTEVKESDTGEIKEVKSGIKYKNQEDLLSKVKVGTRVAFTVVNSDKKNVDPGHVNENVLKIGKDKFLNQTESGNDILTGKELVERLKTATLTNRETGKKEVKNVKYKILEYETYEVNEEISGK